MSIRPINQTLPKGIKRTTAIAAAALIAAAPLVMTGCSKYPSDKFIKQQNQELPSRLASDKVFSSNLTSTSKIENANKISNLQITEHTDTGERTFIFNCGKNQIEGKIAPSKNTLNAISDFTVNSPADKKNYEAFLYYNNNKDGWITKVKDKETGIESQYTLKIEKEDNVAKLNVYDKDEKKIFSQDMDKHKWGGSEVAAALLGVFIVGFCIKVGQMLMD